ncbi:MAG: hypothetical protein WCG27_12365 [Pseudomonadota bacterium]
MSKILGFVTMEYGPMNGPISTIHGWKNFIVLVDINAGPPVAKHFSMGQHPHEAKVTGYSQNSGAHQ